MIASSSLGVSARGHLSDLTLFKFSCRPLGSPHYYLKDKPLPGTYYGKTFLRVQSRTPDSPRLSRSPADDRIPGPSSACRSAAIADFYPFFMESGQSRVRVRRVRWRLLPACPASVACCATPCRCLSQTPRTTADNLPLRE